MRCWKNYEYNTKTINSNFNNAIFITVINIALLKEINLSTTLRISCINQVLGSKLIDMKCL
ncbi:hypothetical protein OPLHCY645_02070 [Clostridium tetani]